MANKREITFEVKEHIADLTDKTNNGYQKQLNLVSWNGAEPKYDIRDWKINEDGERVSCGRGITLSYEEFAIMCQAAFDNGIC